MFNYPRLCLPVYKNEGGLIPPHPILGKAFTSCKIALIKPLKHNVFRGLCKHVGKNCIILCNAAYSFGPFFKQGCVMRPALFYKGLINQISKQKESNAANCLALTKTSKVIAVLFKPRSEYKVLSFSFPKTCLPIRSYFPVSKDEVIHFIFRFLNDCPKILGQESKVAHIPGGIKLILHKAPLEEHV